MIATQLLVVGAGPYALSMAGLARERGIDTLVIGTPMGFWRQNMPQGMFLRSGPDWHLDAAGVATFRTFLEERSIAAEDVDPIPIGVFLDYTDWFRQTKGIEVHQDLVTALAKPDGRFQASLAGGEHVVADAVVCAPGIGYYTNIPDWGSALPAGAAIHTCDLVHFDELAGARVLIVGGRQSAYEWAALLREHEAERIDIVHRHDVPRFQRADWTFVDAHIENTIRVPGYWRNLPQADQDAIAQQFWAVGRLTLEPWLTPRLDRVGIHRWPRTEVVKVDSSAATGELRVLLSNGEQLMVDRIIFATGYRADLARVPYLATLTGRITRADGFPVLDEAFQTSLPGLYLTGFSATKDFGPFFGFVKGAPTAATLITRDLLSRCRTSLHATSDTTTQRAAQTRGVQAVACGARPVEG
jgi:FAD-dependent urate hydroxylase